MRENIVCVTRLMNMHVWSLLANHFRVCSSDISDVIIIGDLHPQQEQLVVNTDQVSVLKIYPKKLKMQTIMQMACYHFAVR